MQGKHLGRSPNLVKDNQGICPVEVTSMTAYIQVKDKKELSRWGGTLWMGQIRLKAQHVLSYKVKGKLCHSIRTSRNLILSREKSTFKKMARGEADEGYQTGMQKICFIC